MAPKQSKVAKAKEAKALSASEKKRAKEQAVLEKAQAETEKQSALEKKKQQSNLVGQLKNSTEADDKDFYQYYTNLSLRDKEKSVLLENWVKNKKIKEWWGSYKQERAFVKETSQERKIGYCQKCS